MLKTSFKIVDPSGSSEVKLEKVSANIKDVIPNENSFNSLIHQFSLHLFIVKATC